MPRPAVMHFRPDGLRSRVQVVRQRAGRTRTGDQPRSMTAIRAPPTMAPRRHPRSSSARCPLSIGDSQAQVPLTERGCDSSRVEVDRGGAGRSCKRSSDLASPRESREVSERIRGSLLCCTWLLGRTRRGKSSGRSPEGATQALPDGARGWSPRAARPAVR